MDNQQDKATHDEEDVDPEESDESDSIYEEYHFCDTLNEVFRCLNRSEPSKEEIKDLQVGKSPIVT